MNSASNFPLDNKSQSLTGSHPLQSLSVVIPLTQHKRPTKKFNSAKATGPDKTAVAVIKNVKNRARLISNLCKIV